MRQLVLLVSALSLPCVIASAQDQDSPALADVARQSRTQKQQKDAKDGQAKDAPTRDSAKAAAATDVVSQKAVAPRVSRVITNEDLPEAPVSTAPPTSNSKVPSTTNLDPGGNERQRLAEQLKSQIQDQKKAITELQNQIAAVSDSIHYAGGNCASNCVQWNERQQRKQQEVDTMKAQLEEAQRRWTRRAKPPARKALAAPCPTRTRRRTVLVPRSPSHRLASLWPAALSNFHSPQNRGFVRN